VLKAWDYLNPRDQANLALAAPGFTAYAQLRCSTTFVRVHALRDPRPPPDLFTGLQHHRAGQMVVALICFDFNYCDLIRWLEGEYTNAHRDCSTVSDAMNAVRSIDPPEGYPNIDFDRAFWACIKGFPLAGMYECLFDSVRARNMYDNHPGLGEVAEPLTTARSSQDRERRSPKLLSGSPKILMAIHPRHTLDAASMGTPER